MFSLIFSLFIRSFAFSFHHNNSQANFRAFFRVIFRFFVFLLFCFWFCCFVMVCLCVICLFVYVCVWVIYCYLFGKWWPRQGTIYSFSSYRICFFHCCRFAFILWLCRPSPTCSISKFQTIEDLQMEASDLRPEHICIHSHLWRAKQSMNKNDNVIDKSEWNILWANGIRNNNWKKNNIFFGPFYHHFCRNLCFSVGVIAMKQF